MTIQFSPATLRLSGISIAPWIDLEGEDAEDADSFTVESLIRFVRRMKGELIEQTEGAVVVRFPSVHHAAAILEVISRNWQFDEAIVTRVQGEAQPGAQET